MNIIPFSSATAALDNTGGKGANLARLTRTGFPVPAGFIIPTDAYRAFVEANLLAETIVTTIAGLSTNPAQLERASGEIRQAFSAGQLPKETESAIRAAYGQLAGRPVAVRSSATAEDLPDLSFAGQQDTFLNIVGEEDLLAAVVKCWSSLWTARAIGYRLRNDIDQRDIALAVIVQQMVESDVSGVLFTANPLTGLLSEMVIDATFGLGEALVSGQVEPDHFVVDALSGVPVSKSLGQKKLLMRSKEGGGLETIEQVADDQPTLSDNQIEQLVTLGRQVQDEVGVPQDIEWAFASGDLYLLQSRPITSLFPVPELSFDPLIIWISFGAIQGLIGPITPLGRDLIRHIGAGSGALFGLKLEPAETKVFEPAGQRLWARISDVIRNPVGSRALDPALEYVDPSARQIMRTLAAEPRLGAGTGKIKPSTLFRLTRFAFPLMLSIGANLLRPEKGRAKFEATIKRELASAQMGAVPNPPDRFARLAQILAFMHEQIGGAFPLLIPGFVPLMGPSMASLSVLNRFSGDDPGGRAAALEVTRSLPGNVTTEMDLALWKTAKDIQADSGAVAAFQASEAAALAGNYLSEQLPPAGQSAVAQFMSQYGMRGVGEIDIGRPRWREQPAPVMQILKSYLDIDPGLAPDELFARGQESAQAAIEKLAAEARGHRLGRPNLVGPVKERVVRAAARRVRLLMGARESPKFYIIRLMGIARQALLDVGREFVEAGTISSPEDLFFLEISDLSALARDQEIDWKSIIRQRRSAYEREGRRRQVPRVLVSDGRAFYEGLGAEIEEGDRITGSPVSPGAVEGIVRVVFDPSSARLAPGEILVCPGTDPAWTPLLMAASGLITEVGGMMTHGSVVARELGVPAVVGVHQATTRLKNGQKIRLDGTTGQIDLRSRPL